MMYGLMPEQHFDDISPAMRVLLIALVVWIVLSLAGCGTPAPVVAVRRQPPAADMVKSAPLPKQTDPTLAGLLSGYTNAAQQYRSCTDKLGELQDWINAGPTQ